MKTKPLVEYMVGKNEISLLNKNTIYFSVLGEIDEVTEKLCLKSIDNLLELPGETKNILINIKGTGREILKLKEIWKAVNKHEKVKNIALISTNSAIKGALSFSGGSSRKKTISLFSTMEEAMSRLG